MPSRCWRLTQTTSHYFIWEVMARALFFPKSSLEREGYQAKLIKNLTFHNQLSADAGLSLKQRFVKKVIFFLMFRFAKRFLIIVFRSFTNIHYNFPMNIRLVTPTEEVKDIVKQIKEKNGVAIHPLNERWECRGLPK